MTFGSGQTQSHANCLRCSAKNHAYDPLVPINNIYTAKCHRTVMTFFHDANTNEKQKNGMSFFSQKRLHFFKNIYDTHLTNP